MAPQVLEILVRGAMVKSSICSFFVAEWDGGLDLLKKRRAEEPTNMKLAPHAGEGFNSNSPPHIGLRNSLFV